MKQIQVTGQVRERLRAAYGPDVNLDNYAVWETVCLTTLPIRKANGIFKGARPSLSLLSELAASVNTESKPVQIMHDNEVLPQGRLFYGEVVGDEFRGQFAVDKSRHPEIVTDIDNGTIDQVSVGFNPKRLTCSGCGFNFADPKNAISLWTLTCDEGHTIGQGGTYVHVDGLDIFFELSLVGLGASPGARIVGPSDARLQNNEQFRLAATANPGLFGVCLSPTVKDPDDTMNTEQMATFSAAIAGQATAQAALTAMTGERDAVQVQLTAAQTQITDLTTQLAAAQQASADSQANAAAAAAALTALQDYAKKVVVAVGKPDTAIPETHEAVLALINEHSAAFAAVIPVGGKSREATGDTTTPAPARSSAAFRAPK